MKTFFQLICVISIFFCTSCLACFSVPKELTKHPDDQFKSAKKVFLGRVVSAVPVGNLEAIPKEFGTSFPVTYKIKSIEKIKGKVLDIELIKGESDGLEYIDSAQPDHEKFGLLGSSSVSSDCKRSPPSLLLGAIYLIFLSDYPDTKDFERIKSPNDYWLKTIRASGRPIGPP